jgi:uncharacterized integral membrane protein
MGPQVCQLLATYYVTLSLTLFALGGADLTDEFCLRTLSFSGLTVIVGLILGTVVVSHVVEGGICEE